MILAKDYSQSVAVAAVAPSIYDVVGNIYLIPLTHIYVDPEFNCRGQFTPQEVHQLGQSINTEGLRVPLIIQPIVDVPIQERPTSCNRPFRLIAGHRRYMALEYWTDQKRAPCMIVYGLTHRTAQALNLTENLQREDLNLYDQARAIERTYAKEDVRDIAKWIGQSTRWVQSRLDLLKLPEFVQKKAASGRLDQYDIETLAQAPIDRIEVIYQRLITAKGKRDKKFRTRNKKPRYKANIRKKQEIHNMISFLYENSRFSKLNNESRDYVTSALSWILKGIGSKEFIENRLGFPKDCVIIDEDDQVRGIDNA